MPKAAKSAKGKMQGKHMMPGKGMMKDSEMKPMHKKMHKGK